MMKRKRHLVRIQKDSTPNGEAETWTTFMNDVPASIEDVRGLETVRGEKISADVDAIIRIRWYDQIVPTMRIVQGHGSAERAYDIKAALDRDGWSRELELHVTEVQ